LDFPCPQNRNISDRQNIAVIMVSITVTRIAQINIKEYDAQKAAFTRRNCSEKKKGGGGGLDGQRQSGFCRAHNQQTPSTTGARTASVTATRRVSSLITSDALAIRKMGLHACEPSSSAGLGATVPWDNDKLLIRVAWLEH
jgi:hypothetical protein